MVISERVERWIRIGWGRPSGCMALAFAALLLVAPGYSPRVELVSGSVEIGTGEPPVWRQAREGDPVRPGDIVRTGHNGRVELLLPAGTVRLYEDSVLRLQSEWDRDGSSETVNLDRGSSIFDIFKRDPAKPFGVQTPEAVVMVKGTRFSVALDPAGASVAVYEGTVSVSTDSTYELLVHEGFAAVGGADHPFELALTFPDSDPWETWDEGGEAPTLPTEVMEDMPTMSDLDTAKMATYASVEEDLNLALSFDAAIVPEASEGTTVLHDHDDGTTPEHESFDPIEDSKEATFENEFREEFLETALGDTTGAFDLDVVNSGGPNFVQISGLPSGTVQLDGSALDQIESGGSLTPLGPDLPSILNNAGIDPRAWAGELQELL